MKRTLLACVASAALGVALTASVAGGQSQSNTIVLHKDQVLSVEGYKWRCQSTSRTPNFSCTYGRSGTPIFTAFRGSRVMHAQSLTRPTVRYDGSSYDVAVGR